LNGDSSVTSARRRPADKPAPSRRLRRIALGASAATILAASAVVVTIGADGPTAPVEAADAPTSSSATPAPAGSVKFSLTIPIYGGGALGANIRKANITQVKTEVDALAARDQVKEAAITAWSTLQNATAQIQSATTAVSAGDLSLQGTIQERDVGQATTLDVLNAQSELESVKEGLIQASASRVIASFALVAATGHLTAADLGLGVELKTGEDYIAKVEDVCAELRALD